MMKDGKLDIDIKGSSLVEWRSVLIFIGEPSNPSD